MLEILYYYPCEFCGRSQYDIFVNKIINNFDTNDIYLASDHIEINCHSKHDLIFVKSLELNLDLF